MFTSILRKISPDELSQGLTRLGNYLNIIIYGLPMTSQSLCSLSLSFLDDGAGISESRLTGFWGLWTTWLPCWSVRRRLCSGVLSGEISSEKEERTTWKHCEVVQCSLIRPYKTISLNKSKIPLLSRQNGTTDEDKWF